MKWSNLIVTLAAAGLVFGLFVGCDGGGSGDGVSSSTTKLDAENVNAFARSISDEVGCQYTAAQAAPLRSMIPIPLSLAKVATNLSIEKSDDGASRLRAIPRESEVVQGNCGGTMTTSGTESKATMTFDNYCTEADGTRVYVDGGISVTSSASGSQQTMTASTTAPLRLKSTNPSTGDSVDVTVSLSDGQLTMGSDLSNLTLSASSVSINDNTTGDKYTLSKVSIKTSESGTNFSMTYTDPELGTVVITGTSDADGNGTVTMKGADGTTATITPGATEGVFSIKTNGSTTGTMDCSMVVDDIPQVL
ncbi:MAG: hypothetical protein U9N52_03625 [Campylobacterota bacterium]|nr:hypothetical protein [Campylobacterota bacterium]